GRVHLDVASIDREQRPKPPDRAVLQGGTRGPGAAGAGKVSWIVAAFAIVHEGGKHLGPDRNGILALGDDSSGPGNIARNRQADVLPVRAADKLTSRIVDLLLKLAAYGPVGMADGHERIDHSISRVRIDE